MSAVFIHGLGAVSPAGWGVAGLREALKNNVPLPVQTLARPGWEKPLSVRPVPPLSQRPDFLAHPRLRRTGVMAQHIVAAALEAMGADAARVQSGELRLGIIVCVMAGCVTYSRRFYEEVLRDPGTASPMLFPETVFNAPASHLGAYLNSQGINYTLVGDEGTFLQGLVLAADWLHKGGADACVVVGAEEMDWIVGDALRLFRPEAIYSGGAGAVYLKMNSPSAVELEAITDSFTYTSKQSRSIAARKMESQLPAGGASELLCHSKGDGDTATNWSGKVIAPISITGEAFVASAAWQCVAACDALLTDQFTASNVTVTGTNQQAIGARFRRSKT